MKKNLRSSLPKKKSAAGTIDTAKASTVNAKCCWIEMSAGCNSAV